MISERTIDPLYDELEKEIKKFHADYEAVINLIYGQDKALKDKLNDAHILSGKWPFVRLVDQFGGQVDVSVEADSDVLVVNTKIWVGTTMRDGSDFSNKQERRYDIYYIDTEIKSKVNDLASAKENLRFVVDHLGEVTVGLNERCDSIINDALSHTGNLFDKLREASKYDLPVVCYDPTENMRRF